MTSPTIRARFVAPGHRSALRRSGLRRPRPAFPAHRSALPLRGSPLPVRGSAVPVRRSAVPVRRSAFPLRSARSVRESALPAPVTCVIAVVAHPDDESFGLGAVLAELVATGARTAVLCFSHGEASTLHGTAGELSLLRPEELRAASAVLGLSRVDLHDYPDGRLTDVALDELTGHVSRLIAEERPSHLLVFDAGGVTGHPDHDRATEAALAGARAAGLPVLAWALPVAVARRLNAELGTAFTGRDPAALDIALTVSRYRQWRAIACHRSQSAYNPVLRRRLELLGDREYLRLIHPPA
jgi:LmbE family N-acetylglucosaminyl deacetylase